MCWFHVGPYKGFVRFYAQYPVLGFHVLNVTHDVQKQPRTVVERLPGCPARALRGYVPVYGSCAIIMAPV